MFGNCFGQKRYNENNLPKSLTEGQIFFGNSKIFCFNHCFVGPNVSVYLVAWGMILFPAFCYFFLIIPELYYHVPLFVSLGFLVLGLTCGALVAFFTIRMAFMDPGIIKKKLKPKKLALKKYTFQKRGWRYRYTGEMVYTTSEEESVTDSEEENTGKFENKEKKNEKIMISDQTGNKTEVETNKELENIEIKQIENKKKPITKKKRKKRRKIVKKKVKNPNWCRTCRIIKPPRSHHCRECNSCIERFDHHCPWSSQCIGKRNYKFFYGFLLSVFLSGILELISVIVAIFMQVLTAFEKAALETYTDNDNDFTSFVTAFCLQAIFFPLPYIILIFVGCMLFSIGSLLFFHTKLVIQNRTTYEEADREWENKKNPYDKGWAKNIKEILFSPVSLSNLNSKNVIHFDV